VKLFVTGASGFIGRSVVACARSRGHDVVGLVRSSSSAPFGPGSDGVTTVLGDVRDASSWGGALAGCDAVIHLAGSVEPTPDRSESMVSGTHALIDSMCTHGVDRFVLVSSISVYDFRALQPGDALRETTPLESRPQDRDDYVRAKLTQEQIARERDEVRTTVLRPGAVYGQGRLWDGGFAMRFGARLGLVIEPDARMKLTYVENCGEAIVLAAERSEAVGIALNLVDDDPPTQRAFAAALARRGLASTRAVSIPYRLASAAARVASSGDRLLRGRLPLPWPLVPARLDAACKPLEYPNDAAKRVLGWEPRWSFDDALARVFAESS
jgi:nucleoside-diphosphate-sugar epimerase